MRLQKPCILALLIVTIKISQADNGVFLTVSPLAGVGEKERLLELNWYGLNQTTESDSSTFIGLVDKDPHKSLADPLERVSPTDHQDGYHKTSVSFPRVRFDANNLTDACLGYWIVLVTKGQLLASSCIRAEPFWMWNSKERLKGKKLTDIMIPGTHNSGMYGYIDSPNRPPFAQFTANQEEDIFNQLAFGIRYLDFRVKYSDSKFWVSHDIFKSKLIVKDALDQIKNFVKATREIVIVDFHRFNGNFDRSVHEAFTKMIDREMGELLIPHSSGTTETIDTLIKSDRRIVLTYNSNPGVDFSWLHDDVRHLWAEASTLDKLEKYFEDNICYNRGRLTAAMAQLTPTASQVILGEFQGLRQAAQKVNPYMTKWFRERWSHCANIVATDYFLGNDVVAISIRSNILR